MKNLLFILFSFISLSAIAGEITFTAIVSKDEVAVGEKFVLTYSLNASGKKFRAPELSESFKIYSGPNQSRSMSLVNGAVSTNLSYSYHLIPINTGEYVIEPAEIEVEGKIYTSNAVKVKIVKAKKPDKTAKEKQDNWKKKLEKDLFVRLELNKKEAYLGEQILATYKLYNRANLAGIQGEKLPEFVGFYTQEIDLDETNNRERKVINGVIYDVYTIKKTILFPQKSGELTLLPLTLDATVRVKGKQINTFFGPQYQYKNKQVRLATKTRKIKVLPLPGNKPESFKGAVGKFRLKADLDKLSVTSNEATNLKIKISGVGNINLAEIEPPVFPTDFEVYDPKINTNISKKNDVLNGNKSWEYLIIPRHSGDFEIPAIAFSYFDTEKKKYITLKSDPFQVHVEKGEGEEDAPYIQSGRQQKGIQQIGSDIRFIKINPPQFIEKGERFYRSFWFYFFIIIPMLMLGGALYFLKKYENMTADKVGMKKRKANKMAGSHLSEAKKQLDQQNLNAFYEEISRALYGYLGDKLSIPKSEQSKENIQQVLEKRGAQLTTITQLMETLDMCEMARFAPQTESSALSVYEGASAVLTQLEKELK